jgi:fucose permease
MITMPATAIMESDTNRSAIAVVYLSAFLQGLAMVSFAASGTVLKDGKGFTDAQYGLIFIPQIATTIVGSLTGGALTRRVGLPRILLAALIATGLSQIGLAVAVTSLSMPGSFFLVLGSTAMFGLAFGLGAAPLNTYPGLIFPGKFDTALVALHTLLGAGLAAGPLLVGPLTKAGYWLGYPLLLLTGATTLCLLLFGARLPAYRTTAADRTDSPGTEAATPLTKAVMWVFIAIAVLYAFAEGTFANWAIIYLNEEQGIDLAQASFALAVFWAMLAAGRLLVSVLLLKINAAWIWLTLPLIMIATLLLLPLASTAASGIALFALAGLSCSAFFPLTVGLASKRFAEHQALVASLLIAALMVGVGLGSFIIGPLRQAFTIAELYRFSTLYPLGALLLALGVILARFTLNEFKARTCKLVLGHHC